MAEQVAKVKAKTRPWRSIIALILALAALTAGEFGKHASLAQPTKNALTWSSAAAFFVFGVAASFGLSGQVRNLLQPVIGAAHAGVTRYALALVGIFASLVIALNLASVPVGQLVLGGVVTSVLLGIAAQQSLSNLFAGMVLLFARPFRVGDRVRFRAGALAGAIEGTVVDISITYVRLETEDGQVFVPNSQALAAVVGPIPQPAESSEPDPSRQVPEAPAPPEPAPQAPAGHTPAPHTPTPLAPVPQALAPPEPASQTPGPQAPAPSELAPPAPAPQISSRRPDGVPWPSDSPRTWR
jgi:hypothetical protein